MNCFQPITKASEGDDAHRAAISLRRSREMLRFQNRFGVGILGPGQTPLPQLRSLAHQRPGRAIRFSSTRCSREGSCSGWRTQVKRGSFRSLDAVPPQCWLTLATHQTAAQHTRWTPGLQVGKLKSGLAPGNRRHPGFSPVAPRSATSPRAVKHQQPRPGSGHSSRTQAQHYQNRPLQRGKADSRMARRRLSASQSPDRHPTPSCRVYPVPRPPGLSIVGQLARVRHASGLILVTTSRMPRRTRKTVRSGSHYLFITCFGQSVTPANRGRQHERVAKRFAL